MAVSTGDFTVVKHLKQQQNLGYNSQRTLSYNTSHTDINYYMSGKLQSLKNKFKKIHVRLLTLFLLASYCQHTGADVHVVLRVPCQHRFQL